MLLLPSSSSPLLLLTAFESGKLSTAPPHNPNATFSSSLERLRGRLWYNWWRSDDLWRPGRLWRLTEQRECCAAQREEFGEFWASDADDDVSAVMRIVISAVLEAPSSSGSSKLWSVVATGSRALDLRRSTRHVDGVKTVISISSRIADDDDSHRWVLSRWIAEATDRRSRTTCCWWADGQCDDDRWAMMVARFVLANGELLLLMIVRLIWYCFGVYVVVQWRWTSNRGMIRIFSYRQRSGSVFIVVVYIVLLLFQTLWIALWYWSVVIIMTINYQEVSQNYIWQWRCELNLCFFCICCK